MKKTKFMAILLSGCLVLSGCGSLNNTAKGGMIGGGSGAALGAIIGGIAGHGKGAAIGAAVGAAVGTGAGVLIGKKMDKAAEQAAQIEGAEECSEPESGHGCGYLWLYRQYGMEKQYCRTECAEKPRLVAGTCTECFFVLADVRSTVVANKNCGGTGRKQSCGR